MSNLILARLSPGDLCLIEPHLQFVDLPLRKILAGRNRRIGHVYFPDAGIASVVSTGKFAVEMGLVGREGMTSVSVVLDRDRKSAHDTYMQLAGNGQRLSVEHLLAAIDKSSSLQRILLQYANRFLTEIMETALSNRFHNIEERLARWLLMAGDRVAGDQFFLTQEALAVSIGSFRPAVTVSLQELERMGCITHKRRLVTVIDRPALVSASNGAYVTSEL